MGVAAIELLVGSLQFGWEAALLICLAFFLLFTLVFQLCVREISIDDQAGSVDSEDGHSLKMLKNYTCSYFTNLSNILYTISNIFTAIIYYALFLWLPHYFLEIGYSSWASWLSILYTVSLVIGNPVYSFLSHRFFSNVGSSLSGCCLPAWGCVSC